jgi:hypothetical protein
MSILSFWKPPKTPPVVVNKTWKAGMWVMYQNQPAIISKIDEMTEIHYVNIAGETVGEALVPLNALRQARFIEIPLSRRNITETAAKELGYGP